MRKKNDKSHLYQSYQRNLIKATVSTNIGINNHDRLVKVYGAGANRIEILNKLKKQSKFTIYWFSIFITLGLICFILDPSGWFNVLDLFVVMINIYLVAKGKLVGMYIGVLECLLYAFICYQTQLFGEVVKVLCISVPLNIYSIVSWSISLKKQKKEKYTETKQEDIVIKKMKKKDRLIYSILFIACTAIAYLLLKFVLKQENALLLSSVALAISIVGKILTAQRFMESYMVFNVGNIICLLMWVQTMLTQPTIVVADITMIIYYLACFSNDIYAYGLWKSMYRKVAVNGGILLAKRKVKIKKIIKLRRQFKNLHWDKDIDISKNS